MRGLIRTTTLSLAAAVLLGGLLVTCTDSGSPSTPSGLARLRIELTDAPTDELAEVNVYISGLKIKPSTGPVERLTADVGPIDLLLLRDTTELLVAATVEPGDYEFIEIELNEGGSSVMDAATGQLLPLKIPSEKIKIAGGFFVEPDMTTTVLLDFDADQSLIKRGNGEWLLKPVILLANVRSG